MDSLSSRSLPQKMIISHGLQLFRDGTLSLTCPRLSRGMRTRCPMKSQIRLLILL
uniref:Uncharacterized protein n=1 Tax=Solanum lycopersicum TaxID=4081 RepID=A0A3Q7G2L6_SOLLC